MNDEDMATIDVSDLEGMDDEQLMEEFRRLAPLAQITGQDQLGLIAGDLRAAVMSLFRAVVRQGNMIASLDRAVAVVGGAQPVEVVLLDEDEAAEEFEGRLERASLMGLVALLRARSAPRLVVPGGDAA